MEQELDLIRRKGFAAYFLLVKDLVSHAAVARTCGRGSGAASLVSYVLELTNVDPIDTNLVFERFLTEARKDPPDLDIDFAWDERDAVIQSVFERYGRTRVAMVANHCFFKPKGALRAVALAHGRPETELKSLAKFVRGWDGGIEKAQENPAWDADPGTGRGPAGPLPPALRASRRHRGDAGAPVGARGLPARARQGGRLHHLLGQGGGGGLRPGEDRPARQPQPGRDPGRPGGAGGPRAARHRPRLPRTTPPPRPCWPRATAWGSSTWRAPPRASSRSGWARATSRRW